MATLSLNGSWTMRKKGTETDYPAIVPTTMYEVLYENGLIEDPFYGENDQRQTQLSEDDYSFHKVFRIEADVFKEDWIEIEFKGLDTLATIYINGECLAQTNNMHRTYRYEVKDLLVVGDNCIKVEFASPTKYIRKEQGKDPLWGVTSTIAGYEHLRKAHHQFGWDWGPQMPDMGIWRDVTIYAYSKGLIEEVQVTQRHHKAYVTLEVTTDLKKVAGDVALIYTLKDAESKVVTTLRPKIKQASARGILTIDAPRLWWPNGYGDPYLYSLEVTLVSEGEVVDEDLKRIGLRTMTVVREADTWGETFDFTINGLRIFAMGADYIPEDTLITRPTRKTTERLIKDCVKANYNCLRVWGGAYYPSDTFYDLCDSYGLIVWQDFMFACGVYRLTKKFEENITAEFRDNIRRLRHHASLGLWCGNNEMEWGFVEWGLPKDERLKMDYLLMYEKLIPDVLADHDPERFYWPASPSSGGGFDNPNGDNKGDVHYWNVFHNNEHYKKFREHYFKFASEYGMQAFPDMKTINSYLPDNQRNIFSPVMENHNKCTDPMNGNVKIMLNMAQEFLLPLKFEDQVYLSQVFQGETIKCAVEHFRRNRGRCMGSTYWQVNDNYPVASWASIDYYGRWKAMHYMAKSFYAPVLLSAYEEGFIGHIHLTNDRPTVFEGQLKWQLRHISKGVIKSGELAISIEPLRAQHLIDVDISPYVNNYGEERSLYLSYQLIEGVTRSTSETLLFVTHKTFEFEPAQLTFDVGQVDGDMYVEIHSNVFAKSIGIQTKTLDLIFEDNYFDLLPGETRRVVIDELRTEATISLEDILADLYLQAVNSIQYQ